jgi:hypothetical protein
MTDFDNESLERLFGRRQVRKLARGERLLRQGEPTKPRRDSTRAVMGRASAPLLGQKPQRLSPCIGPSFGASSCR